MRTLTLTLGKRFSLLEVSTALKLFPGVRDCVVLDITSKNNSPRGHTFFLAALFEMDTASPDDVLGEVRRFSRAHLPEHMRPFYLFIGDIPRNANGKVRLLDSTLTEPISEL